MDMAGLTAHMIRVMENAKLLRILQTIRVSQ